MYIADIYKLCTCDSTGISDTCTLYRLQMGYTDWDLCIAEPCRARLGNSWQYLEQLAPKGHGIMHVRIGGQK